MTYYDDPQVGDMRKDFLEGDSPKVLFVINAVMAVAYFLALVFLFQVGNRVLFTMLVAGEVFHLWQVLTFLYTVWDTSYMPPKNMSLRSAVDIFVTVCGEPVELVEETVRAIRLLNYPAFTINILNDGYVAKKENWREIEALADRLGVRCITRTVAGNINNALRLTESPLVAIFDADHVPHADFLQKTVPYFGDLNVGFVQTPQFYKNYAENYLTRSSWEQQELFFGPICKGKNRLNAATMCGTNMLIRRSAFAEVGGMCTDSIAEDFVTGLLMHAKGYTSVYVPEVLAEGLATEDLLTYSKQQFRWARGALDVIFRYNPLFMRGLTWPQRIQYLASASFYLSGLVVVFDMLLPIVFFFTGMIPVVISSMFLALVFLPYMFLTLYSIQRASNFTFTFPSLGFSMGGFNIHLKALYSAVTRERSNFEVTEKQKATGNFLPLVRLHIVYLVVAVVGAAWAVAREGFDASVINNIAWVMINGAVFYPFIQAALPEKTGNKTTPNPLTVIKQKHAYGIRR
jgi:cellulose synthase (UDP-forming)